MSNRSRRLQDSLMPKHCTGLYKVYNSGKFLWRQTSHQVLYLLDNSAFFFYTGTPPASDLIQINQGAAIFHIGLLFVWLEREVIHVICTPAAPVFVWSVCCVHPQKLSYQPTSWNKVNSGGRTRTAAHNTYNWIFGGDASRACQRRHLFCPNLSLIMSSYVHRKKKNP